MDYIGTNSIMDLENLISVGQSNLPGLEVPLSLRSPIQKHLGDREWYPVLRGSVGENEGQ